MVWQWWSDFHFDNPVSLCESSKSGRFLLVVFYGDDGVFVKGASCYVPKEGNQGRISIHSL